LYDKIFQHYAGAVVRDVTTFMYTEYGANEY